MKKLYYIITISLIISANLAHAEKRYPNISGSLLTEVRTDSLLENNNSKIIKKNAGYLNAEFHTSLNFNENWSFKNAINFRPTSKRQSTYPERSRFILGQDQGIDRGINIDDSSLIVEEIKIAFENEDMKFAAGKLNPSFATLYRRNKRIGFFITDYTEDYELREKIGFNLAAILEDSEINLSTFFSDATDLSSSGLNNRGNLDRNDGTSSNTGTLSSYSITLEGRDFLEVDNLFYNVGYRSLGVENRNGTSARETGYTINLEYLYQLGQNTYLIPLIEYVKIDNFTGRINRDARYVTTALILKYNGWNGGITYLDRQTENNYPAATLLNNKDSILQFNMGYKFKNNFSIDISRASIEEDNVSATAVGAIISYFYEF